MIRIFVFILSLVLPAVAHAEWREARSNHFLIYSEGSERQLREFTEKLEKFHYVLRMLHNIDEDSSPVKAKVFLLRNIDAVQASLPFGGNSIAGYYEHSARGPILVGTLNKGGRYTYFLDPESILLHEYAHHFMFTYFPAAYPPWYREGFAEFWGEVRIGENDVVEIGLPSEERLGSLQENRWIPINRLLAPERDDSLGIDGDLLYSQGWLLMRYVFGDSEKSAQLQRYLDLINAGTSYREAMNQTFGENATALNRQLRDYSGNSRFTVLSLPFRRIDPGEITIRSLRPAEEALIVQEMQLGQGVVNRFVSTFAEEVRSKASRFPDDPYALGILAEAERLAGNTSAAVDAVDRLLRIDPRNPRGLMQKGLLQAEALKQAGDSSNQAWSAARGLIIQANNLTPDDPLILEAYYDTYIIQGEAPPPPAQNALFRALELAPGDDYLRYKVAADFEGRNMIREALHVIRPSALAVPEHRTNPDESEEEKREREERRTQWRDAGEIKVETAREMLARLERKLAESGHSEAASPSQAPEG